MVRMLVSAVIALLLFSPGIATAVGRSDFLRQDHSPGIIIFLHGIFGDGDTWKSGPDGKSWPEIVRDDHQFDGMDILIYKYPSSFLGRGFTTDGVADKLKTELNGDVVDIKSYETVVFVAHSLGGIIARKYVLYSLVETK